MLPLSISTNVGAAISRLARKWSSHQIEAACAASVDRDGRGGE